MQEHEAVIEDSWIETLFQWANDNNLPELEYVEDIGEDENGEEVDYGYWCGFPRDKKALLDMTELNLDWHDLAELPGELKNLRQLRIISVCRDIDGLQTRPSAKTNNKLRTIPSWVTDLPNLQSLFLSGNEIQSIPEDIGRLSKLEILHLGYNRIQKIPESIEGCCKLKQLDLSANEISNIPEHLYRCGQLKCLWLKQNKITALPKGIRRLAGLESLSLSDNRLAYCPDEICQLESLESLQLSGNLFTSIPLDLPSLEFFDMVMLARLDYERIKEEKLLVLH